MVEADYRRIFARWALTHCHELLVALHFGNGSRAVLRNQPLYCRLRGFNFYGISLRISLFVWVGFGSVRSGIWPDGYHAGNGAEGPFRPARAGSSTTLRTMAGLRFGHEFWRGNQHAAHIGGLWVVFVGLIAGRPGCQTRPAKFFGQPWLYWRYLLRWSLGARNFIICTSQCRQCKMVNKITFATAIASWRSAAVDIARCRRSRPRCGIAGSGHCRGRLSSHTRRKD